MSKRPTFDVRGKLHDEVIRVATRDFTRALKQLAEVTKIKVSDIRLLSRTVTSWYVYASERAMHEDFATNHRTRWFAIITTKE